MDRQEQKNTTSVKITRSANAKLDMLHVNSGVGKIELISRLAEWLSSQDKTLQAIILGQIDAADELAVLNILRKRYSTKQKKSASKK